MQRTQEITYYNDNISGTCHRILYNTFSKIKQHKKKCNCKNKCEYNFNLKLIEVDEFSMVDMFLYRDILDVCKYFNARLIILGDTEQLPSIAPGKVLHQLILSEMFSVTKLTKIKRQNAGGLVNNILKMTNDIITKNDEPIHVRVFNWQGEKLYDGLLKDYDCKDE
jgi:hypothetical protein